MPKNRCLKNRNNDTNNVFLKMKNEYNPITNKGNTKTNFG